MNRKEKLEMLQRLDEKTLTKNFLIPLYESEGMGCKNVRYTHKSMEFGKDIIYYINDEYERRIYTAVQIKKIKITTSEIDTIQRQIFESFGEPFTDLLDGKKKNIDRIIVLTSNEIIEQAKDSLYATLKGARLERLVTLIDGNEFVCLLEKKLPQAFWDQYDCFNKYFSNLKKEFENIKEVSAIGQMESIPLEDIYVSLKLCEKMKGLPLRMDTNLKIFEEKIARDKMVKQEKRDRIIDTEKALNEHNKLMITGAPGSGKTTLLRHLALKLCKENLEKGEKIQAPIPITLGEFSESGKDLREYIDKVFEKFEFPKAKNYVEEDLKQGKCVLLLDGFDELATRERQDKVTSQIQGFLKKYPKARIIATSRIAGYHDELKGFTKLELMEFDDKQIERFIDNWFKKTDPDKGKSMFKEIRKNKQIKSIAQNPLMISIIAIIYEEDKELPQKRVELYERCVEVLLSKWDKKKKLKNRYPSDSKEFILKKLAFLGHCKNKRILTEKEIMEDMLKHFPRLGLKEGDAKPFLDEIWQRSYLLRQVSRERYDFLHLSFQEYFTALELKDKADGISIIIRHLQEPWWEEPILLYAGLSKDACELIRKIQKKVPEDIFFRNLILSGKCISIADYTPPELKKDIINKLWDLYKNAEFEFLKDKAIQALSLIKSDNIINLLINDLKDKDGSVRERAAWELGNIGSDKAIDPLINSLEKDKDVFVRGSAAWTLGNVGSDKTVDPLINLLGKDKDSSV
ncbi:HEAT repeat domain-containing protein, partial [Candidatus Sumerlaeota bacterium]|nr:HEAT repeat domain-containing protein [Candidatus Sumerlaeota bacterium]